MMENKSKAKSMVCEHIGCQKPRQEYSIENDKVYCSEHAIVYSKCGCIKIPNLEKTHLLVSMMKKMIKQTRNHAHVHWRDGQTLLDLTAQVNALHTDFERLVQGFEEIVEIEDFTEHDKYEHIFLQFQERLNSHPAVIEYSIQSKYLEIIDPESELRAKFENKLTQKLTVAREQIQEELNHQIQAKSDEEVKVKLAELEEATNLKFKEEFEEKFNDLRAQISTKEADIVARISEIEQFKAQTEEYQNKIEELNQEHDKALEEVKLEISKKQEEADEYQEIVERVKKQ